jgi:DNA-binding protein YbaB
MTSARLDREALRQVVKAAFADATAASTSSTDARPTAACC